MIIKDEIIILREIAYKDYDKILHVFSREHGKLSVMARSSRKPGNKMFSVAQLFNHSKVEMYKGKDMYTLNEGELIDNFYTISKNYDAYVLSSYVLELLNYIIHEDDCTPEIFEMTLVFLDNISGEKCSVETLLCAYEIKLSAFLGFRPELKECVGCGKEKTVKFSIENGGIICEECAEEKSTVLTEKEINIVNMLLFSKFDTLIETEIPDKIKKLVHDYLTYHIDKSNFKALKMTGRGIYG